MQLPLNTELERLYSQRKTFQISPIWHFDGPNKEKLQFQAPLDIDHVTEEGFYLRAWCFTARPDECVVFNLILDRPGIRAGSLSRIEWRPIQGHRNNGLIAGQWRWKEIKGDHFHDFHSNKILGWHRMVSDNLPIAEPIEEELGDFRALLNYAGSRWNIADMQKIPVPDWQARLA